MKSCLAGLVGLLALASSAGAQQPIGAYSPPVVNPQPTISPYLNLNRGGGSPAINYYGLVRPQIENHQAIQNLQQQFQATQGMIQNQAGTPMTEEIAPTGRPVGGYLNYSHYFPLFSRGAGGTAAGGAAGKAR